MTDRARTVLVSAATTHLDDHGRTGRLRLSAGPARLAEPSACAALFRAAIAPFGFDTFACGDIDPADRDRNIFHLIDWPEPWARFYTKSGMIEHDPVLGALAERREPFTWSDLRADRKLAEAAREALDLAAQAGWIEGLVAPLPSSGARVGLVGLAGHRLIADRSVHAHLCLLSTCLHSHVRTLTAARGFAQPPMGLTDREMACLRLVIRGRSDAQVATELAIAPTTAHEFVEKAKRRLKVRSRPELAAVAVAYGLVEV